MSWFISNPISAEDSDTPQIKPCGVPKPPSGAPPPEPDRPYIHPSGERLQHKWLHFSPPPGNSN